MYFNILLILVFTCLGKGFFSWDEEYIIAIGLFLVIYFLYSLLKMSLFSALNDSIDKIALKFMFFYTLNIIMLKILINSFKREFYFKNSTSYAYLYLSSYTSEFSSSNRLHLINLYKSNINYLLIKLTLFSFELNKQFYFYSNSSKMSEINNFIYLLNKIFETKSITR